MIEPVVWYTQQVPKDKKLYVVYATYARQLMPSKYWVCATSKKEARELFIRSFPWLNYIFGIDEDDTDISDPTKYIVIGCDWIKHEK